MRHPSGVKILFNEYGHKYYVEGENKRLMSVTQILKKYFPVFEKEKVAKLYAKKHGLKWQEVVAGWTKLGEDSSARGKKYHHVSEKIIKGFLAKTYRRGQNSDDIAKMIEHKLLSFYKEFHFYPPEYIVACLYSRIAGAIDLVFGNEDTLYIMDWKFVKEIKIENPWRNCHFPIDHIPDCNFYKFALQLNLYSYIIRKNKYFPQYPKHELGIFHVKEDEIEDIRIPNMQSEVRNILIHWEKTK